ARQGRLARRLLGVAHDALDQHLAAACIGYATGTGMFLLRARLALGLGIGPAARRPRAAARALVGTPDAAALRLLPPCGLLRLRQRRAAGVGRPADAPRPLHDI